MANYLPGGNINPSVGVKMDTVAFRVVQCSSSSDKPVGISQEGTQQPPGVTGSDGLAGRLGGPGIRVFEDKEECLLVVSATVNPGDRLKLDSNGQGTPVLFTGAGAGVIWSVARALETNVSGDKARVVVEVLSHGCTA